MILVCNGMPCAVFDGVLSQEEAIQIDNIISNVALIEDKSILGSAINSLGQTKRNKGAWIDNFKPTNSYGFPTDFINRVLDNANKECPNWVWRYGFHSEHIPCLVSYYEDGDGYPQHYDMAKLTLLLWLHRGDKKHFSGGDLILEDGQKIEFKNNRVILFPSVLEHSVTEVKMNNAEKEFGRYVITGFFQ